MEPFHTRFKNIFTNGENDENKSKHKEIFSKHNE